LSKNKIEIIKKEIIEACKLLEKEKFFIPTWGNISVKYNDEIIITPSKIEYDKLTPNDLLILDIDKNILDGENIPSSETDLHLEIYRNREDVKSVVHTHSEYASIFSVLRESIPPITEEQAQLIGGEIKCSPKYIKGGDHIELAKLTTEMLGDENSALIPNHGVVCCGRNLKETVATAKVVEKTAKLYLFSKIYGKPKILTGEDVKEERYRFLYKYGKKN